MPLLMVVLIGAVILWLLLSVFFEKIGGVAISVYRRLKNNLINNDGEENDNE